MQVESGVRAVRQVVVVRKGGSLVMRRRVMGAVPELVRLRVCWAVWPEVSWPKFRGV